MRRPLNALLLCTLLQPLAAQQHADCATAMEICEKKTYTINRAEGEGANRTEADMMSCFMNSENAGQSEENSTWIKFEIAQDGALTFAITPHRASDDFDWVVFKLAKNGHCDSKKVVRCMAAGDLESEAGRSPCLGETGLRWGETDDSENAGCTDLGDNAWLAPLKVVKGEKYVLLVSNVTSRGPGFHIRFGGTALLPCDKPKNPPVAKNPEKPEKKPKPTEKSTPPAPKLSKAQQPTQIENRNVSVLESPVKVKSRRLKIKVWDSQVEDGDVISLYLNDAKILDRHYLRLKPHSFEIELGDYAESYLTIVANEYGKAAINSAAIEINDGNSVQTVKLKSDPQKSESLKIVLD
jgi:hypothetical protein